MYTALCSSQSRIVVTVTKTHRHFTAEERGSQVQVPSPIAEPTGGGTVCVQRACLSPRQGPCVGPALTS